MTQPERPGRSLEQATVAMGLSLSPLQFDQLRHFEQEVARWNKAINLVARNDMGRFRPRHLLDSLSLVPLVRGRSCIDLGSGAGLPGLPLAITLPTCELALVERSARKARFLRHVVNELKLSNVVVYCQDAATLSPESPAQTVVSRAMAPPQKVWSLASPLLSQGGRVLILSRTQTEWQSTPALDLPPEAQCRRQRVAIPGLAQQHEVLIMEKL